MPEHTAPNPNVLPELVGALSELGEGEGHVCVSDILAAIGQRSYSIVLLVPAIIMVSPLSGIFGLPTLTSLLMATVLVQALMGREQLWLPASLRRRAMPRKRYAQAVAWLKPPLAWVDRNSGQRLHLLVSDPVRFLCRVISLVLCLLIPFLELLPFITSIAALAITLMALGMILRDGLFVLAGWAVVGGFAGTLLWLLQGASIQML